MRKGISSVFALIASIAIIVILLLTSVDWVAFNEGYYRREYRKLGRPEAIGISEGELMSVTRDLLNYLKDKREDLNIKANIKGQERFVFGQREIQHMVDVKVLFMKGYALRRQAMYVAFLALLALALIRKKGMWGSLSRAFILAAFLFLAAILIMITLLSMDFTRYFNQFHYMFFSNDLWQLDPEKEILIQMVPEQFFFDTALRIILTFVASMAVLAVAAGYNIKRMKKIKN